MENKLVQSLISCKKFIITKPRKEMYPDSKSPFTLRNEFTCASNDGVKRFDVFMRKNTRIPFLFSIGLKFRSEDGNVILCRYNGKHEHKNKVANKMHFDAFHIHRLYDNQLTDDTSNMLDAEVTDRYVSFHEALYAFLTDCNIQDWNAVFPNLEDQINQLKIEEV